MQGWERRDDLKFTSSVYVMPKQVGVITRNQGNRILYIVDLLQICNGQSRLVIDFVDDQD